MHKEMEILPREWKNTNKSKVFINKALLESVTYISELTHGDHDRTAAKVKSASKMVMLPPLFDHTKPEMAKEYYKRFNQYIKFQTKNGNVTDPVGETIEFLNIL